MRRCVGMFLLVVFVAGSMTACNTVKGVGKDLEKVGGKMQESADRTGGTQPE